MGMMPFRRAMSLLFDPYRLGPAVLRNRIIRSATTSYWSDEEGNIRPEIVSLYSRLAEGGAGLIIKGHLYVTNAGKAHTGMAGISEDHHLHGLKALTEAVHEQESSIIAQLNHAGLHSVIDRAGPSEYVEQGWKARALSGDEIGGTVEAFGDAAENALVAGFCEPSVLRVSNQDDLGVAFCHKVRRVVRGVVVHNDDLVITCDRLFKSAKATLNKGKYVVCYDDRGEFQLAGTSPLFDTAGWDISANVRAR